MTEAEWVASADPRAMLQHLRWYTDHNFPQKPSDRKLRLFATACCRQVWDGVECAECGGGGRDQRESTEGDCPTCHGTGRVGGLTDPRSRRAVEVAERHADEAVWRQEIDEAYYGIPPGNISLAIRWCCTPYEGYTAAQTATNCAQELREAGQSPATQAALLREVFDNPFRPLDVGRFGAWSIHIGHGPNVPQLNLTPILLWHDGTVPRMAQAIYDGRRWDNMPILADALLDAGCDDEELIWHCRGQERCPTCGGEWPHACSGACRGDGWISLRGPHVRGCWAVDLILGRN